MSILRTRSAIKGDRSSETLWHEQRVFDRLPAVLVLVAACAILVSCDPPRGKPLGHEPPSEPPRPAARRPIDHDASLAELLGLDAGDLPAPPPEDPQPPAGDLAAEVQAFSTLEDCIAARTSFDPVVGDAVDALGYDTLKLDACRVLMSIKTHNPRGCDPIASSSLRFHCEASVAIVVADSSLCPVAGDNHDAYCVALAKRNGRLCATVDRDRRATCTAVLDRDERRCGGDARCIRVVQRWKGLVAQTAPGPELGSRITLSVTQPQDAGHGTTKTFDLSQDAMPATVRTGAAGTVILIGEASTQSWPPALAASVPRMSVALQATPASVKQGRHVAGAGELSFALLVPKVGTFSADDAEPPVLVTVDLIGLEIGAPIRFALDAKAPDTKGGSRIRLEINTYVRDVVTVGK